MRRQSPIGRSALFAVAVALAGSGAACSSDPGFLFLTRPGQGTTGSAEESAAYYAAMDVPPEPTLTEWMQARCFTPQSEIAAFYYNQSDLGLGREMRCTECTSGPRTGLISCAVSNHGIPQGLDRVQFGRDRTASIKKALSDLEKVLDGQQRERGATVAMDYDANRPDKVRFYIYDARDDGLLSPGSRGQETLIPGLQLDGEGGAFNQGVKYMRNCLSCHGGRYDAVQNRIFGASFLDFDLSQFVFSDDPMLGVPNAQRAKDSPENRENLRRLNALILKVVEGTGATEIKARIEGSYPRGGGVNQPGAEYDKGYVPRGWPADQVVRQFEGSAVSASEFYKVAVHSYCATCHFSQTAGNTLSVVDPAKPLTFSTFQQWFQNNNLKQDSDSLRLIRREVCGASDMPHAEVTRLNLRSDAKALAYICN